MKHFRRIFLAVLAMFIIGVSCNREPDNTTTTTTDGGGTSDSIAPTLSVISPTNNGIYYGAVTISGTATDNVGFGGYGVYLTIDANNLGIIGKTNFLTNVSLSDGSHTISLQAFDAALNRSDVQRFNITVNFADTLPPVITMNYPSSEGQYLTNYFTVSATINDASPLSSVMVAIDSATNLDMTETSGVYLKSFSSNDMNQGPHNVRVIAKDQFGNTSTNSRNIYFVVYTDTTAPSISIFNPLNDGKTYTNHVSLSGSIRDNVGVYGADIQLDSDTPTTINLAGSSNWSKNYLNLSAGSHGVTVRAWDQSGNTNSSARYFEIVEFADTNAPVINIINPASSGQSFTNGLAIYGTIKDNFDPQIGIAFALDGGAPQTLTLSNTSNWSIAYENDELSTGSHSFQLVGWDSSSNTNYTSDISFNYVYDISIIPELFISEYAESVNSDDKYVEIFNPTESAVELANYQIRRFSETASAATNDDWDLAYVFDTWSGELGVEEVAVLANPNANSTILSHTDFTWSSATWDGNDAIGLFKTEDAGTTWELIDSVGYPFVDGATNDPSTGWDVAGITTATKDHVLARKDTVTRGNTNWTNSAGTSPADSEWIVYADGTNQLVGAHPDPAPDLVAPTLTTAALSDLGGTSATLTVAVDEDCGVYYVVLPNGSSAPDTNFVITTPTSISGHVSSGNMDPVTVDMGNTNLAINGLADGTEYDLYVVSVDPSSNKNMIKLDMNNSSGPKYVFVTYDFDGTGDGSFDAVSNSFELIPQPVSYTNNTSGGTPQFTTRDGGKAIYATYWIYEPNTKYIVVSISWASGTMDFDSLSFENSISGTGPTNYQIYTSVDGFTTPILQESITNTDVWYQRNVDLSGLTGVSSPFIIRFSASATDPMGSGSYRLDNVMINGILNP